MRIGYTAANRWLGSTHHVVNNNIKNFPKHIVLERAIVIIYRLKSEWIFPTILSLFHFLLSILSHSYNAHLLWIPLWFSARIHTIKRERENSSKQREKSFEEMLFALQLVPVPSAGSQDATWFLYSNNSSLATKQRMLCLLRHLLSTEQRGKQIFLPDQSRRRRSIANNAQPTRGKSHTWADDDHCLCSDSWFFLLSLASPLLFLSFKSRWYALNEAAEVAFASHYSASRVEQPLFRVSWFALNFPQETILCKFTHRRRWLRPLGLRFGCDLFWQPYKIIRRTGRRG